MNAQQAVSQTQQQAPAVQAAATPAAPQAQQMVEILTPQGPRMEPVAVVNQRLAGLSAAEQRIIEQNNRIAQLEQSNQTLAVKARFADELQADLVASPEQFVAKAERLARLANGTATPEDQAAAARSGSSPTEQALREMKAQLQQVQDQLAGSRAVSDVQKALEPYDLFKNNPIARKIAETTLASMRLADMNTPLVQLASTLHTQMAELVNGNAQQTYQTRVERQTSMPQAPAGHTPGMTSPEPPPTVKDLQNGGLRRRLTSMLNGPHGIQ